MPSDNFTDNPSEACHPFACSLQACLQRNVTRPDQCRDRVEELYRCCRRFYRTYGEAEGVEADACPNRQVLDRHLAKMGEETVGGDVGGGGAKGA